MPKKGKDLQNKGNSVLVIGYPKAGKTRLLGTASRHEKLYILSLENGLATIAGGGFDYDDCPTWELFEQHFEWFMLNYKKEGYTALGIDSISRAQQYFNDYLMRRDKTNKLTRDQFGESLAKMTKLVDVITSDAHDFAPIVISHQSLADDGQQLPSLTGAIKYELSGYFDTVLGCRSGLNKDGKAMYWCELNGSKIGGTRLRHLKNKSNINNDYAELVISKEK